MRNIVMPDRVCQRPGCGNAIPSHKRRDARWCSRRCESKARRQAARKARFEVTNPDAAELLGAESQSLAELYDHAAHQDDDADRRTPEQRERDERFAALIAGAEPAQRAAERRGAAQVTGHVQSRFDVTTAGAVASNGAASRGLNRRPVARPLQSAEFDFRSAPVVRQSGHAAYRWNLPDGFVP